MRPIERKALPSIFSSNISLLRKKAIFLTPYTGNQASMEEILGSSVMPAIICLPSDMKSFDRSWRKPVTVRTLRLNGCMQKFVVNRAKPICSMHKTRSTIVGEILHATSVCSSKRPAQPDALSIVLPKEQLMQRIS